MKRDLRTYWLTTNVSVRTLGANVESRDRLRWPGSNRNGGRHQIGIPGRIASELAAQLTTAVFTAAFEPLKKQIESAQKSARTFEVPRGGQPGAPAGGSSAEESMLCSGDFIRCPFAGRDLALAISLSTDFAIGATSISLSGNSCHCSKYRFATNRRTSSSSNWSTPRRGGLPSSSASALSIRCALVGPSSLPGLASTIASIKSRKPLFCS